MLVLLVVGAYGWVVRSPFDARRDDVLPALAVLVSALGLATIARLSSELAHKQETLLALSLGLVILLAPACDAFRRLAAYKYVWVLGSILLFGLVAVFGQEVNGAKLWIRVGPVQYEPIEIIKLFIVFFMAAYLAETSDVIAAAKPWSIRANVKYLGPLFLGWATSMAILVFERDIGMASLLLATFAAMLYVATRRIDLIAGGAAMFALAVTFAGRHYPYVIARFAAWRDPFADPLGRGYQALQGLFSLAAGGLFGTGYGLGHPGFIPAAGTDYIYAAWSEEFGALGGAVLIAAFLVMIVRALRVAQAQPDLYAKILASGLAATLGFQVFIIVGGVLGLFPLTGITLPFFSYGGSSLVANYILIALVWAIGSEPVGARARA
ncbi:MAG: FtsW/RodA/SpoVE family cell cycle protein [Candidatus Eremiobacteraeota bacterium]|nr:FtsW/RodA/SpoVE family cell cycle protein [Candidatus Eremiobacteraeota bacterium]